MSCLQLIHPRSCLLQILHRIGELRKAFFQTFFPFFKAPCFYFSNNFNSAVCHLFTPFLGIIKDAPFDVPDFAYLKSTLRTKCLIVLIQFNPIWAFDTSLLPWNVKFAFAPVVLFPRHIYTTVWYCSPAPMSTSETNSPSLPIISFTCS